MGGGEGGRMQQLSALEKKQQKSQNRNLFWKCLGLIKTVKKPSLSQMGFKSRPQGAHWIHWKHICKENVFEGHNCKIWQKIKAYKIGKHVQLVLLKLLWLLLMAASRTEGVHIFKVLLIQVDPFCPVKKPLRILTLDMTDNAGMCLKIKNILFTLFFIHTLYIFPR